MRKFLGVPYPIRSSPKGFFYSQDGIDQIKSDMLCLLLTNPGERVMNPFFGTTLRRLIFEPNDSALQLQARNMILNSIKKWEPRIAVRQVEVKNKIDKTSMNKADDRTNEEHILFIRIIFVDPQQIQEVQELVLEVPLTGGA
jgi:phage baseplate assembly protein W